MALDFGFSELPIYLVEISPQNLSGSSSFCLLISKVTALHVEAAKAHMISIGKLVISVPMSMWMSFSVNGIRQGF
jgi:hypothetical protein